jgi:pimeloyl-ACP methyl ester carboxylesterase
MQIDVGGLNVHYEEHGGGRPILMLHGWPSDHRLMTNPLEPIFEGRPGWRRIYPDLPGMGRTPGPDSISDQAGMLKATLDFMDAVAPNEPFALVGASYGGYLALGVLHERFASVTGLMLWAPMFGRGASALPQHRVFRHDPEVDALLLDDERAWLDISVSHTPATLEAFRASVKPGLLAADRTFLKRVAGHLEYPFDPMQLPTAFDRPSLLLAGHQDSDVGYARTVELLAQFPRATLAVLDRAGHGLAEEQRSLFRALVGDWLDRMALDGVAPDAS